MLYKAMYSLLKASYVASSKNVQHGLFFINEDGSVTAQGLDNLLRALLSKNQVLDPNHYCSLPNRNMIYTIIGLSMYVCFSVCQYVTF